MPGLLDEFTTVALSEARGGQKTGGSARDVEGWQFEGVQCPLLSKKLQRTSPNPENLRPCATPITMLWHGLTLVKVRKLTLSFVTKILAPESQMIGKDPSWVSMTFILSVGLILFALARISNNVSVLFFDFGGSWKNSIKSGRPA